MVKEQQKRKEEELNKWKHTFQVVDSGKEKDSPQVEMRKKEQFEKKLINTLKKNKLSQLEDLSHSFNLPTKEIIDKIKDLEKRELIDGIFDERGKYL